MKLLAIEKEVEGVTPDRFQAHLKAEAAKAWELYQTGAIRELYFRQDAHSAVLVLECKDVDEANSVLSALPLVKEGLIAFDIVPLVAYPGFSRLFAEA